MAQYKTHLDNNQQSTAAAALGNRSSRQGYVQPAAHSIAGGKANYLHGASIQRKVVQFGKKEPKTEGEQQHFHGLIYFNYRPIDKSADMHVAPKGKDGKFSWKDAYFAIEHLLKLMKKSKVKKEGELLWKPGGAAVVKGVAEILGEALGGDAKKEAQRLKKIRKEFEKTLKDPPKHDPDAISKNVIPEHMESVKSLVGRDDLFFGAYNVSPTQVSDGDTSMSSDTTEGTDRRAMYKQALEAGAPIALNIKLKESHLPQLLATMESMN